MEQQLDQTSKNNGKETEKFKSISHQSKCEKKQIFSLKEETGWGQGRGGGRTAENQGMLHGRNMLKTK